MKRISTVGPKSGSGPVRGGNLRPAQFLDHLTVIKIYPSLKVENLFVSEDRFVNAAPPGEMRRTNSSKTHLAIVLLISVVATRPDSWFRADGQPWQSLDRLCLWRPGWVKAIWCSRMCDPRICEQVTKWYNLVTQLATHYISRFVQAPSMFLSRLLLPTHSLVVICCLVVATSIHPCLL